MFAEPDKNTIMLSNYLKIAWRNLWKNRQFTFLNLAGLSTGLACAILIYLWVYDELTFDRFHKNDRQLYQVMENLQHTEGVSTTPETAPLLAEAIAGTMPEVEYATVTTPPSWFPKVALSAGDKTIKACGLFAGKDYFNIFSYPLVYGHPNNVLADKQGIVISEKLASALFHTTENLIGRSLVWQVDSIKRYAVITGVFQGTPANSSVQFDFALPFSTFKDMMGITGSLNSQNSNGPFLTYLVLKKGAHAASFNISLSHFMKGISKGISRSLFLKPYAENYLYGNYENGVQSGGRITYVKLFSLIALFIIIIACINFMNLSTAKAAARMKEMGVRKAIGAGRRTLIFQYLGESMLVTFLALAIALLLVALLLPTFNDITGKQLSIRIDSTLVLSLLGITLMTGLLAGSYPALYVSGFNVVAVLKGKLHNTAGELWVRKGLVVFQFALSVIFVVAMLVMYRQIAYVQTRNPGYDKDHVIYFEADGKIPANTMAFLAEARKMPGVINAASMVGSLPGGAPSIGIPWTKNGQDETIMFRPFLATYDLIETLGIQMAAGRTFSREYSTDASKIILNEAAIKTMGITDPVGKVITFGGRETEIIGVTKNFHFQSFHEMVKPLFFQLEYRGGTVMVKLRAGMEKQVITNLSALYKTYNPGFSFDYKFLDETYQAQYVSEKRVAALSRYCAGLALLISCLGLSGLIAFTAERRRKEIGIRKVLGATVGNVVMMLSKDFLKSVLIAVLAATPLAWWAMHQWLDGFAYHIRMRADVFLLAGGCMVLITLLTISFQAVKAALANPASSLSTE